MKLEHRFKCWRFAISQVTSDKIHKWTNTEFKLWRELLVWVYTHKSKHVPIIRRIENLQGKNKSGIDLNSIWAIFLTINTTLDIVIFSWSRCNFCYLTRPWTPQVTKAVRMNRRVSNETVSALRSAINRIRTAAIGRPRAHILLLLGKNVCVDYKNIKKRKLVWQCL